MCVIHSKLTTKPSNEQEMITVINKITITTTTTMMTTKNVSLWM